MNTKKDADTRVLFHVNEMFFIDFLKAVGIWDASVLRI